MKRSCINFECSEHQSRHLDSPVSGRVSKKGSFYRQCDRRYIQRYKCLVCKTQFSKATLDQDERPEGWDRLFRRTWSTTKKVEALIDHLWIYVRYHNTVLVAQGN